MPILFLFLFDLQTLGIANIEKSCLLHRQIVMCARVNKATDERATEMDQTPTKRKTTNKYDKFEYVALTLPLVLLWLGFAINGWDGVWVFDVQSWTVFPSIAHDYKLIMQHYGDEMAYRCFQYTLHSAVYAYLVAVILVSIRIGLSSKYPFPDLLRNQTKYRLFRGLLIINLVPFCLFFLFPLLNEPGEYLTVRYYPMSPKHMIASSMCVSGACVFLFTLLILAFRIFIKGEKLYED
jgi:hypothetical protein